MPIEVPSFPFDETALAPSVKLLSPKDRRKLMDRYKQLEQELRDANSMSSDKYARIHEQMQKIANRLSSGGVTQQELALAGITDFQIPGRYRFLSGSDRSRLANIPLPDYEEFPDAPIQPDSRIIPPKTGFRHIFSGCDIRAVISTGTDVIDIGNLSTVSYSIHRDKFPVRVLGRTYAKGYARGGRTIAGTLIWAIFDQAALSQVTEMYGFEMASDTMAQTFVPDQLPPFDITIAYMSEVDDLTGIPTQAFMKLMGVEIVDEGQSHGTDDLYFENVMQFIARDIEHMVPTRSGDPYFDRRTPFSKALFQAEFENQKFTTWQTALQQLGEQRAGIAALLDENAKSLDLYFRMADVSPTAFINNEKVSVEDLIVAEYDKYTDNQKELQSLDRQIAEAREKLSENRSFERRRAIVDPTRGIGDNPFDPLQQLR